MKVLSLYCGGGGIDQGLKESGLSTTLAIDIELDCCKTMKENHHCETINSQVSDVKNSLGKFDIVVGGPPCPEFSVAKANKTFDSTQVDLFWEIIRDVKPKYWLMENVPGVIRVCKERNFLVNCADYGTPQTRIRRFYTNLQLPKQTHSEYPSDDLFGNKIEKWVSVGKALNLDGIIEDRKTKPTNETEFRKYPTGQPAHTLLTDSRDFFISGTRHKKQNRYKVTRPINEPVDTIVVAESYQLTNYPIYSQKYIKHKNPTSYKKHPPKQLTKPSGTIRSSFDGDVSDFLTDGKYARKVTNDELAILQGFPKDYKFSGKKGSIRRQIGNAVPPQPVKALFSEVLRDTHG